MLAPVVWGEHGYIEEEEVGRGAQEGPARQGVHLVGGRALHPRGRLGCYMTSTPSPLDHVRSKNHAPEGFIPFGLRLIFLFLRNTEIGKKQQFALGLGLIG